MKQRLSLILISFVSVLYCMAEDIFLPSWYEGRIHDAKVYDDTLFVAIDNGKEWHEYSGSQPTVIRNPRQSETTSDCYTVDGRRVCSQDKQKGIYIQNGKKVIIK